MNTRCTPEQLAIDLLDRSKCSVQVACVIADNWGIFSWGTNHTGFDGYGMHAEAEAIRRANRRRLAGAILYVAGRRARNHNPVNSRPCERCQQIIHRVKAVYYRDKGGLWQLLR